MKMFNTLDVFRKTTTMQLIMLIIVIFMLFKIEASSNESDDAVYTPNESEETDTELQELKQLPNYSKPKLELQKLEEKTINKKKKKNQEKTTMEFSPQVGHRVRVIRSFFTDNKNYKIHLQRGDTLVVITKNNNGHISVNTENDEWNKHKWIKTKNFDKIELAQKNSKFREYNNISWFETKQGWRGEKRFNGKTIASWHKNKKYAAYLLNENLRAAGHPELMPNPNIELTDEEKQLLENKIRVQKKKVPEEEEEMKEENYDEIKKINDSVAGLSSENKSSKYSGVYYIKSREAYACRYYDRSTQKVTQLGVSKNFGKCVYTCQQIIKADPDPSHYPPDLAQKNEAKEKEIEAINETVKNLSNKMKAFKYRGIIWTASHNSFLSYYWEQGKRITVSKSTNFGKCVHKAQTAARLNQTTHSNKSIPHDIAQLLTDKDVNISQHAEIQAKIRDDKVIEKLKKLWEWCEEHQKYPSSTGASSTDEERKYYKYFKNHKKKLEASTNIIIEDLMKKIIAMKITAFNIRYSKPDEIQKNNYADDVYLSKPESVNKSEETELFKNNKRKRKQTLSLVAHNQDTKNSGIESNKVKSSEKINFASNSSEIELSDDNNDIIEDILGEKYRINSEDQSLEKVFHIKWANFDKMWNTWQPLKEFNTPKNKMVIERYNIELQSLELKVADEVNVTICKKCYSGKIMNIDHTKEKITFKFTATQYPDYGGYKQTINFSTRTLHHLNPQKSMVDIIMQKHTKQNPWGIHVDQSKIPWIVTQVDERTQGYTKGVQLDWIYVKWNGKDIKKGMSKWTQKKLQDGVRGTITFEIPGQKKGKSNTTTK